MGQARDESERPLQLIAMAFTNLAVDVRMQQDEKDADLRVASFASASSRVSILFGCLGIAFKFAERDYVSKVQDLMKAANDIQTLQSLIELDLKDDSVRVQGSHSRNLLRVKRGLDMVRVLFQGIVISKDNSLRDPASQAYNQVFAPHHSFPIRAAVAAGLYALPTKSQLLNKLNEDENSARNFMQEYITAVDCVIEYVDGLFLSRGLGIDW